MLISVPPIVVDTASMLQQYRSLDGKAINAMLDNIAKGLAATYAMKLETLAQQLLHKTKRRYIQNIRVVDSGKLEGTVLLDYSKDKLIQMIEEGADPFDMKAAMLKSAKVKTGKKGGKYLTIPFRIGTPGGTGDNELISSTMPKGIYNVIKKAPTTIPVSGGGMRSAGLSLRDIPTAFQAVQTRPVIKDGRGNDLFKAYQHKSSIYQGMVKRVDGATGQSTYGTFRRVSEKSDPDAFIHPGIEKYNLMSKALGQMDIGAEMGNQIDNELNRLGL